MDQKNDRNRRLGWKFFRGLIIEKECILSVNITDSVRTVKKYHGKKRCRSYTYFVFICKNKDCNDEFSQVKTKLHLCSGYCKKCSDKIKLKKAYKVKNETTIRFQGKSCKIQYKKCDNCKETFIKNNNQKSKRFCSRKCNGKYHNDRYYMTAKGRYNIAKRNALKSKKVNSKKEFNLTLKQYTNILKKYKNKCFYCDDKIENNGVGLDRIDSSKGYSIDNVVTCCRNCNFLKGEHLTKHETLKIIQLIKSLRGGKVWN